MSAPVQGALVIDKPIGPTSHDVVARVRRTLGVKAGHTGTLDPLASGVLVALLGKATRLTRFFQGHDKVYEARIRLGETTETFDAEGAVVATAPVPPLERESIETLLAGFTGSIEQVPPIYSAIKVGGEPLYKKARKGEAARPPSRLVTIHSLRLIAVEGDFWTVRVHCSSGTYVRSLAHDIGGAAGCGAHLADLRRVRSGPFSLEMAVPMDHLATDWENGLQPMESLLPEFPRIDLDSQQSGRVRHGNFIPCDGESEFVRLFSEGGLVSIARLDGGRAVPMVVF